MMTLAPRNNSFIELSRTLSLLHDVCHALEENDHFEEARMVSEHLRHLSAPDMQSRINEDGIDPVLSELAKEFSDTPALSV